MTLLQEQAIKKVKEKLAKGQKVSVSQIMRDVGYSETSAVTPIVLTDSNKWKEQMEELLPDSLLLSTHKKLLKQKQIEYFTFSKSMSDEEIIDHVSAAGFEVIVVRESEKGKLAFYSIDNSHAIGKALEMAYKIKGKEISEKKPDSPISEYHSLETILTRDVITVKEQTLRLKKEQDETI